MPHALLVNPENTSVSVVHIDNTTDAEEMQSIQTLLDCTYFESAPPLFPRTQTLVPDTFSEELSGRKPRHQFHVRNRILGPIKGNMLVIGERDGEVVDCHIKPNQLRTLIQWDN